MDGWMDGGESALGWGTGVLMGRESLLMETGVLEAGFTPVKLKFSPSLCVSAKLARLAQRGFLL